MPQSHVAVPVHFVFSTKDRVREITPEFERHLWSYLAGAAQGNDLFIRAVGGHENHIHLLADLPATRSIAEVMQRLKQASSRWMHETMRDRRRLCWQPGYGAFGLSPSAIERTIGYIERQHEHHRLHTFEDEYLSFLNHHRVPYDPRYIWK